MSTAYPNLVFYATTFRASGPKFYCQDMRIKIDYSLLPTYTISTSVSPSGKGTITGGGTYTEGNSITLTATPNTGYYVSYWQKNGVKIDGTDNTTQGANTYTTTATGNDTYTAVFNLISYSISYNLNGGSVSVPNKTSYDITTDSFSLNEPTKDGADFIGWTGSNGSEPQRLVTILQGSTGNKNYTANYQEWTYSIVMDGNGADEGSTSGYTDLRWGSGVFLTKNGFIRYGYTFKNWNTKPDGTGNTKNDRQAVSNSNLNVSKNGEVVTLYAQWQPNPYTIKFDSNGGIGSMSDLSMIYDIPSDLPINTFTKAGHTFNGWNTAADGSGTHYDNGANVIKLATSGTITLYAQWTINQYTITWKDWDGSELEQKKWDYGSYPSYSGDTELLSYETDEAFYDFDGWIPNISLVSGNMTYTATYIKTIKTYTVTWVDWDGDVLETDPNVPYGTIPTFNYTKTPHKEPDDQYYYVFNNNWDIAIAPVTGNITYTAVYTKNIYYTVVWKDWNEDVLETDKVMYDTPPSYDREDPTRESTKSHEYKFLGWKTEISDEYVDEDDLDVVRADITYIAVYEEIERMYSFSVNILPSAECGRVEGYTDSEYKYGSELRLTAFSNDGYQFVSWSYTVDGVTQTAMGDTLEISIFEDTVVTAIFEERAGLPIMINETQVEAVYINTDALTIIYVISGD